MEIKYITLTDKNEMFFEDATLNVKVSFKIFGTILYTESGSSVPRDTVAQLCFDSIKEYIRDNYSSAEEVKTLSSKEFHGYLDGKLSVMGVKIGYPIRITPLMTSNSSVGIDNIKRGFPMLDAFVEEMNTPKSDIVDYKERSNGSEITNDHSGNQAEETETKTPWWKRIFK